jgi:hypothetical protein
VGIQRDHAKARESRRKASAGSDAA